MTRTVSDIAIGFNNAFPPAGKHLCRCIDAKPWTSPKKKTPAAMLTFVTQDGLYQFEDPVFVSPKALSRLSLVAQRLCQLGKAIELPDDDMAAARQLARYITDNAKGQDILLTIEESEEQYLIQEGPDLGQVRTRTRRRVAFGGYEILPETPWLPTSLVEPKDDVPF